MDERNRTDLEEFISRMNGYKARHTELITVLVPAGFDINLITKQLESEKSTAANIKSTTTRKNVQEALESLIRVTKGMKQAPKNGVGLFAGNVSTVEGQDDFITEIYEPPEELGMRLYRCDQVFVLDPFEEMLEEKEVYGLIVIERNEATIGLLVGKKIKVVQNFESYIPGKTNKGGQCLSPDTLIMKDNGEIIEIKDSHNPLLIVSENFNTEKSENTPIITKWENEKELYNIVTKYPRVKINASKDHIFFVRTEKGIEEKALEDINIGDYLIMPEKIEIVGETQIIDNKKLLESFQINKVGRKLIEDKRNQFGLFQKDLAKNIGITQTAISSYEIGNRNISKNVLMKLCDELGIDFKLFINNYTTPKDFILPDVVNEQFSQFLGYFLGDGSIEENRITLYEQREDLAKYYKESVDNLFNTDSKYKFRENKNYHQIRIYSKDLVNLIKLEFPEIIGTLNSEIPKKILKSPNCVLAHFIKGLFDAEGYVSGTRVSIGVNNHKIIKQLQFCLLRYGIISSIHEYDNKCNPYSNNIRYTLAIDDLECLKKFYSNIGFNSVDKEESLKKLIDNRSAGGNIRQLVVNGKDVSRILKNSSEKLRDFNCPMFFSNKRQLNKETFKRKILDKINNSELKRRLEFIYNSNLIITKINNINPLDKQKTIDIETKNHNFIANGLVVHNSSARYARIRDNMAKEFYRKIADVTKEEFFHMKKMKGILVGGPGPTKEDFLKEGQLVTELYEKVIAVKDIGYADEHGLELLVEASQEELENLEITKEKKVLEKFFNSLGKDREKTALGQKEVDKALEMGAANLLLLSKKLGKDLIKEYEKKASETSADVVIVSVETEEGQQFYNMGGYGAMLRFNLS